jgi:hypothetical protein
VTRALEGCLVICCLHLQNGCIVLVSLSISYVSCGEIAVAVWCVLLTCRHISVMYASFSHNACFSTFMHIILEASCVKMFVKNHKISSPQRCLLSSFSAGWLVGWCYCINFNSAVPSYNRTVMFKKNPTLLHFNMCFGRILRSVFN